MNRSTHRSCLALASVLAGSLLLGAPDAAAQGPTQPHSPGIESDDYVWNEVQHEQLRALRARGDARRGAEAYRICHGCHKAGGLGTADGIYPRIAGQHDTFLMKQLVDVREGRRDNPKMYPFASEHAISTQDIADLAAYLSALPSPADNDRGDGRHLARGEKIYRTDCASCHGENGEGQNEKFYPRVGGQHYRYLRRESIEIRDHARRNANPRMVRVVKPYSNDDLDAVADYMARLSGEARRP